MKVLTTSSKTTSYHQLPFHLRGPIKEINDMKLEIRQMICDSGFYKVTDLYYLPTTFYL